MQQRTKALFNLSERELRARRTDARWALRKNPADAYAMSEMSDCTAVLEARKAVR